MEVGVGIGEAVCEVDVVIPVRHFYGEGEGVETN